MVMVVKIKGRFETIWGPRIGSSCWLIRVVRVGKKGKGGWYLGSKVGKISK